MDETSEVTGGEETGSVGTVEGEDERELRDVRDSLEVGGRGGSEVVGFEERESNSENCKLATLKVSGVSWRIFGEKSGWESCSLSGASELDPIKKHIQN